ncbi:MAG: hypothetical protein IH845_02825 [Nanoarchaeota archaeon]|nr:hypothetical protein [Nanoarchaeota archaeon]
MERRIKKKGLSPVIASVLLILLVLVLASLIFLWARGFISEQIEKFDRPVESLCEEITFVAELVVSSGYDNLEVRNTGDVDIFNFEVKRIKGGNSETDIFKFSVPSKGAQRKDFNFNMEDGSQPDKIIVYPTLVGNVKGKDSNRVYTCINQGQIL